MQRPRDIRLLSSVISSVTHRSSSNNSSRDNGTSSAKSSISTNHIAANSTMALHDNECNRNIPNIQPANNASQDRNMEGPQRDLAFTSWSNTKVSKNPAETPTKNSLSSENILSKTGISKEKSMKIEIHQGSSSSFDTLNRNEINIPSVNGSGEKNGSTTSAAFAASLNFFSGKSSRSQSASPIVPGPVTNTSVSSRQSSTTISSWQSPSASNFPSFDAANNAVTHGNNKQPISQQPSPNGDNICQDFPPRHSASVSSSQDGQNQNLAQICDSPQSTGVDSHSNNAHHKVTKDFTLHLKVAIRSYYYRWTSNLLNMFFTLS